MALGQRKCKTVQSRGKDMQKCNTDRKEGPRGNHPAMCPDSPASGCDPTRHICSGDSCLPS